MDRELDQEIASEVLRLAGHECHKDVKAAVSRGIMCWVAYGDGRAFLINEFSLSICGAVEIELAHPKAIETFAEIFKYCKDMPDCHCCMFNRGEDE